MSRDPWKAHDSSVPLTPILIITAIVAVIVAGVWLWPSSTTEEDSPDDALRALAAQQCVRVDGRISLRQAPFSGTMCSDGSMTGVLTVDSQPMEVLVLPAETYINGSPFIWDTLGVAHPEGATGWALYVADGQRIIEPLPAVASLGTNPDVTVKSAGDNAVTVSHTNGQSWKLSVSPTATRQAIDAAIVPATSSPMHIAGDGYGGLRLEGVPAP